MAFAYHVALDVTAKKCVVIGGGSVATRKTKDLLKAGARVLVVSPYLSEQLQELVAMQAIQWIEGEYADTYLKESFLVVTATNDRQINHHIAEYCRTQQILVNSADSTEDSDFIVNACVRRGDLTLSVSTNGKSPALARKIRKDLSKVYGEEYAELVEILAEVRQKVCSKEMDQQIREQFFRNLVYSDLLQLLREGKEKEVRKRVEKCLSAL